MVDVSRTHSQWWTADREHGTEGRLTGDRIPEITGIHRNSQWDFPRRRALFTSDGTYSISSESDTSEGHVDQPLEGEYVAGRRTEERQDEDGAEGLGFPHKTLERAVTQLQLPHGIRDHEKTDAGASSEPPRAKTGEIYVDPSPEVLGKVELGKVP